jgi:hypothetical protein
LDVDELSLMTLPELAQTAYSECSHRASSLDDLRRDMGSAHDLAAGGHAAGWEAFLGHSGKDIDQEQAHVENLQRIRLVVRKQLNGDDPDWMAAYLGAKTDSECESAKASYDAWTAAHKPAPTAKSKAKRQEQHSTPKARPTN